MIPSESYDDERGVVTPAVRGIVIVTLVAYALQRLLAFRLGDSVNAFFALSHDGVVGHRYVWQLVTYLFLHGGLLHLFMNMFVLHSFGRVLERMIGTPRFLALYFLSGVLGGVGWLAFSGVAGGRCIGASGAVFGIMAAFAAIEPERVLSLVLFPVPIPVRMKARTMVLVFGLVSVVFMVLDAGNVAHAAHLSGGLVGYWYGRRVRLQGLGGEPVAPTWESGGGGRPHVGWMHPPADAVPDPAEVDRILEKVRAKGLDSLTRQEREVLEWASRGKG